MKNAFCSWSGGKDSCLALYRSLQDSINLVSLFTMCREDGVKSRSHGLYPDILKAQADSLGANLVMRQATWDDYEETFKDQMSKFESKDLDLGIFGDIDIDAHRQWVHDALSHTKINVLHPIWQESRRSLIEEFVDLGFEAMIVAVNTNYMPDSFLGRIFNKDLIVELEKLGVDACGENGEFHTVVTNGPIFKFPIELEISSIIKNGSSSMLDLSLKTR